VEKIIFHKGYAEIHIQRPFFYPKKDIERIVVLKIQTVRTCFGVSSTYYIFFLKRIKISLFVGISKSLKLIVFGQILTKSGNFGQIQLLWQWLTTCPHLKGKK
jgi:hypothetical protein